MLTHITAEHLGNHCSTSHFCSTEPAPPPPSLIHPCGRAALACGAQHAGGLHQALFTGLHLPSASCPASFASFLLPLSPCPPSTPSSSPAPFPISSGRMPLRPARSVQHPSMLFFTPARKSRSCEVSQNCLRCYFSMKAVTGNLEKDMFLYVPAIKSNFIYKARQQVTEGQSVHRSFLTLI